MIEQLGRRMKKRTENTLKKWFVEFGVPANRRFGIKIKSIEDNGKTFILKLPYRRKNLNVGNTVHGSAIMALAETIHGVAVLWQFNWKRHSMFTTKTELTFVNPGKSDLYVRFSLGQEKISELHRILDYQKKTEVTLYSRVVDTNGKTVADLKNTYYLCRKK